MKGIDWLTDPHPYWLLHHMVGAVGDRKLRLAAVVACRQNDAVMEDERCRHLVDVAERYADGQASPEELDAAFRVCIAAAADLGERVEQAISAVAFPTVSELPEAMEAVRKLGGARRRPDGSMPASQAHRELFHDIFHDPFRLIPFHPDWRTPTVLALAQTMYDERRFAELPVLADALEEAGCDNTEVLDHLHQPGPHFRGCWALDLCLGLYDMTEAQWLAATDPRPMYLFVHPRLSERQLRLIACGCCRRIWDLASDLYHNLLVTIENYTDGHPVADDDQVYLNNHRIFGGDGSVTFAFANLSIVDAPAASSTGQVIALTAAARGEEAFRRVLNEVGDPGPETDRASREAEQTEKAAQTELLRCIVGNPFRSVSLSELWKTDRVVRLARSIYDQHDFQRLPELAEALLQAGCDQAAILEHCRDSGPHARGCWVVDHILT